MIDDIAAQHQRLLQRLAAKARKANNAIAEEAAEKAKANAPVRTGALRDSIHAEDTTADPMQPTADIRADAPYAAYVNWGTERQAAQPFMSEAVLPLQFQAAKLANEKMK
jgi:HK97 gp10 family phage protein